MLKMNEELKIIISAEVAKFKQGVDEAKGKLNEFAKKHKIDMKTVQEGFQKAGEVSKKAMATVGLAITGAAVALLSLDEATKEYRQNQALLATAFETAGGSAETAKKTYNDLYRVLGDDGQATEAAQHLAQLTTNQQHLSEWTNIAQGVYATFGASLPIESLTEAANETAKTGQLTGALADALNWAGVNEGLFSEQLAACNTEAEREALIRTTLNGLYSEAAAGYETNNAAILAQNEAQVKMNDALSKLGEAMAPINAMLATFAADILEKITPYIISFVENHLPTLQAILDRVATAIGAVISWIVDNWDLIVNLATVIGAVVAVLSALHTVMAIVNAVMAANPITLIIAAVVALIAIFTTLWTKCEGFRNFWKELWEGVKKIFNGFVESVKPLINAIVEAFKAAWEAIKAVWNLVKPFFEKLWNGIKSVFSVVKDVLGGFFKAAWDSIKVVWNTAVNFFTTIWNNIKTVFSVVKDVLTGNFRSAWEGIKQIFSNWGSFFTGLWNSIKQIFSNVGQAIGNAISNTVKTAVNTVLRVAVGIINGFVDAINFAIGVINLIPGVNIGKLNRLNVPQMAKGGIVDSATLAVIGENGKEAVVPLENNLEWLDKLASMLGDKMGGGSKQIVLNVDGKTFAQTSINSINELTRQTGTLGLVMG